METIVLIIHLVLALSIIGLVLIQRSEGGGLGIGGGSGGMGGFATAGQTANALTRLTGFCAAAFFTTSLILAILAGGHSNSSDKILKSLDKPAIAVDTPAETSDIDIPDAKGSGSDSQTPSAPISE